MGQTLREIFKLFSRKNLDSGETVAPVILWPGPRCNPGRKSGSLPVRQAGRSNGRPGRGVGPLVLGLAGMVFLSTGFFSCKPAEKKIKIALAMPLTGDIASLGQGLKRAVTLAIEEANKNHLTPQPLELVVFDDRSDPREAVSVANRIASDRHVVAVIGHFNSGCSIPASRVYAQAGLAMLTPASSNPELTLQQLSPQWVYPKSIFRANTTDNVQGAFGADFVSSTLKLNRVAIIHDKSAYGQGVAEEFKKQFELNKGVVTAFEGLQVQDRDFRSLLTRVKATQPQALYFGGMFSEGGILVRQLRDIGFKGPFVTCEANYDPAFLKVAGEAAEGAYVTFLGSPPELLPTAQEFIVRYRERYPTDELKSYDAYGYETGNIIIDAIKTVGTDRAKIIEHLRGIKFTGVLGTTSFDEKGDTLNKAITLFQVKKGAFVHL
ncbi:MAG: Leucine-, isoleucine-, valine-, threonine-, and alanine-binding protein [Elusimicrobia bacterium]|nr:Leucine-, isoleucine-, valine-, threonine-, and alanine-binding protein [Elusimicrobiota bacterium]